MGNPILTIGIPTYNRPESIKKSVRALLPQLNDQVVLRVWDNCSDTPVADLFTEEEQILGGMLISVAWYIMQIQNGYGHWETMMDLCRMLLRPY